MIDIKAAQVTGSITHAKARILWKDGELRGYDHIGLAFAVKAEKPVKRSRWVGAWDCQTEAGAVVIRSKCWACGGWLKVAGRDAEYLWGRD